MPRTSLLSLLLVVGCAVPPDESIEVSAIKELGDCPLGDCGTNTSVINGVYFSELHFGGDKNDADFYLAGYGWLPNGGVKLEIADHNRLIARDAFGTKVAESFKLKGSVLIVKRGDEKYEVKIADVRRELQYWAKNDGTQLETYRFEYRQVAPIMASIPTAMCIADQASPATLTLHALVFDGDRYDNVTKKVDTNPDPGWFNIACLAGGPAKQHLMRHTKASSDPGKGIDTTPEERQAMLNMWTANYCGDGTAFTYPGQPIRLRDSKGWLPLFSPSSWWMLGQLYKPPFALPLDEYEAIWDENGAVCMNIPRLDDSDPEVQKQVRTYCDEETGRVLSRCTKDQITNWKQYGHILTGNPPP